MSSRWTKSDVVFFQDPHDPTVIVTEQPFVRRNFHTAAESVPAQDPVPALLPSQTPRVEDTRHGFESLGTILLELCFGTPIEWHPFYQQAGTELPQGVMRGVHLLAAIEWLGNVAEEAGTEYAEAVA